MPFGVTKHAWDKKAMEADELESLLVTVNNINTNSSGTVFIVYMPDEFVGEAAKLFAKRNYTSYDKIFVYKYKQDSRGVNTWIHAVETVYVFFQDSRAHCPHSFPSPDPRRRHNLLFSPPTFPKYKDAEGQIVNETERPFTTMAYLAHIHRKPDGRALVLGAGMGGDVLDLIYAGLDVYAVDYCEVQFPHLQQRFNAILSKWSEYKRQCDEFYTTALSMAERCQIGFGELTNHHLFLQWLHERYPEHAPPPPEAKAAKESVSEPQEEVVQLCASCGSTLDEPIATCGRCGSNSHVQCSLRCPANRHPVCAVECAEDCKQCAAAVDSVPSTA